MRLSRKILTVPIRSPLPPSDEGAFVSYHKIAKTLEGRYGIGPYKYYHTVVESSVGAESISARPPCLTGGCLSVAKAGGIQKHLTFL